MMERLCLLTGCIRIVVSESYTTVCCSECGTPSTVKRERVFRCSSRKCSGGMHATSGRDWDAVRAILKCSLARLALRYDVIDFPPSPTTLSPRQSNQQGPEETSATRRAQQ